MNDRNCRLSQWSYTFREAIAKHRDVFDAKKPNSPNCPAVPVCVYHKLLQPIKFKCKGTDWMVVKCEQNTGTITTIIWQTVTTVRPKFQNPQMKRMLLYSE